jgi:hypothetical protein
MARIVTHTKTDPSEKQDRGGESLPTSFDPFMNQLLQEILEELQEIKEFMRNSYDEAV